MQSQRQRQTNIVIPLPKKGNLQKMQNYREITLMSVTAKKQDDTRSYLMSSQQNTQTEPSWLSKGDELSAVLDTRNTTDHGGSGRQESAAGYHLCRLHKGIRLTKAYDARSASYMHKVHIRWLQ